MRVFYLHCCFKVTKDINIIEETAIQVFNNQNKITNCAEILCKILNERCKQVFDMSLQYIYSM